MLHKAISIVTGTIPPEQSGLLVGLIQAQTSYTKKCVESFFFLFTLFLMCGRRSGAKCLPSHHPGCGVVSIVQEL